MIMDRVSPDIANALHIERMAARYGEDQTKIACAMLVSAVRHLVMVGGIAATMETLTRIMQRIGRGEFEEPHHTAGTA